MMKGFSLTQPWSQAVLLGIKQWETRSWPTRYRGEVAIHAAKGFPKWCKDFAVEEELENLPLGQIICLASITDCQRTEYIRDKLSSREIHWGDYGDGRYAFRLECIRPVIPYVSAKGALGLWTVPKEIEEAVRKEQ